MALGGDVVGQEDYRLLLGYPDEKISEKYRIDFSTSKIGGLPVRKNETDFLFFVYVEPLRLCLK